MSNVQPELHNQPILKDGIGSLRARLIPLSLALLAATVSIVAVWGHQAWGFTQTTGWTYSIPVPSDPSQFRYVVFERDTQRASGEVATYAAAVTAIRNLNVAMGTAQKTGEGILNNGDAGFDRYRAAPWIVPANMASQFFWRGWVDAPAFNTAGDAMAWLVSIQSSWCAVSLPIALGPALTPGGNAPKVNTSTLHQTWRVSWKKAPYCGAQQPTYTGEWRLVGRKSSTCSSGFDAGPDEVSEDYSSRCASNWHGFISYFGDGAGEPPPPPDPPPPDIDRPGSDDAVPIATGQKGICTQFGNPCEAASGAKIEVVVDYQTDELSFVRTYRSRGGPPGDASPSLHTRRRAEMSGLWYHNFQMELYWKDQQPIGLTRPDGSYVTLVPVGTDQFVASKGQSLQVRKVPTIIGSSTGYDWVAYNGDGSSEVYDGHLLKEIHTREGRVTRLNYQGGTHGFPSSTRWPFEVVGPSGHVIKLFYGHCTQPTCVKLSHIELPDGGTIHFSQYLPPGSSPPGTYARATRYQDQSTTRTIMLGSSPRIIGLADENNTQYATFAYDIAARALLTQRSGDATQPHYQKFTFVYDDDLTQTTVTDSANTATTLDFQDVRNGMRAPSAALNAADGKYPSQVNDDPGRRRITDYIDEEGRQTNYVFDTWHKTEETEAYGTVLSRARTFEYLSDLNDLPRFVRQPSVVSGQIHEVETTYYPGTQRPHQIFERGRRSDTNATISRATTLGYNAVGQVEMVDGPRSGTADTLYLEYWECTTGAKCGRPWRFVNPNGHLTTFDEYDLNGRLVRMTDPNGLVTYWDYDLRGRLTAVTETPPVGTPRVTTFEYFSGEMIDKVTLPNGLVLDAVWNAGHFIDFVADNFGNRTDYSYDSRGNLTGEELKTAAGVVEKTRTMAYDARNRLGSIQEGTNPATILSFDATGVLTNLIGPRGYELSLTSDALARTIMAVDFVDGLTRYGYDDRDNITTVIAPNSSLTALTYDDFGRKVRELSADRGINLYGYDESDNLTCLADGRNSGGSATCEQAAGRWAYTNDNGGRVKTVDFLSTPQTPDLEMVYDEVRAAMPQRGRLTTLRHKVGVSETVTNAYTYSYFGNLLKNAQTVPTASGSRTFETQFEYDGNDQVTRVTYPSGRIIDYVRDAAGRIAQIQESFQNQPVNTIVTSVEYYPFGPPKKITYGNGVIQERTLNSAFRPSTIRLLRADTQAVLDSKTYELDSDGNILSIEDDLVSADSRDFDYDPLGRLVLDSGVSNAPTHGYDGNGNRLFRNSVNPAFPAQVFSYVPNSNRLSAVNGTPVTYDGAGNLLSTGMGQTFSYNAMGRLEKSSSGTSEHLLMYNGQGELVRSHLRASDGCGGWNSLAYEYFHFDPTGRALGFSQFPATSLHPGVTVDWVWLDDLPVAQFQDSYDTNGVYQSTIQTYLHADHLGSARLGTDSAKQISYRWQSDAFGNTTGNQGSVANRLRFPGQVELTWGLYYNYYRTYSAPLGRYLESDPIGLEGGLNPYMYGDANPVNATDPLGLKTPSMTIVPPPGYARYSRLQATGGYIYPNSPVRPPSNKELSLGQLRYLQQLRREREWREAFSGVEDALLGYMRLLNEIRKITPAEVLHERRSPIDLLGQCTNDVYGRAVMESSTRW